MTNTVAFLPYPPSADLRARLQRELGGAPEIVTLTEVGRLRSLRTLWSLRRFRGCRGIVAVEDETSLTAIPLLHAVAVAAGTSPVELLAPGGDRRRLGRAELAAGVAGSLAVTTAWATAGRRRIERRLERLVEAPRASTPRTESRRALYLNSNLWFGLKAGGSVAHVAGVVNGFVDRGITIDFFGPGEAPLLSPDVRVVQVPAPSPLALRQEANVQRFQRHAVECVVQNARPPYEFLYQRNSIGSHAGVEASRALATPLVLEYNGSEVWTARRWGHGLRYERLAVLAEEASLTHATLVVTVSDASRDELLERGVPAERVIAYPNGVDPSRYAPDALTAGERRSLRTSIGIDPTATVAGFIGTFGQWHGVDVLARAIVRLAEGRPELVSRTKLHFLLVGDGLRMAEVRSILDGAAAVITTLTGLVPQEEGSRYLAASDLLLSPHVPNPDGSRFFGSPTKLFEYMATGRPIIASDLEQIGEVLRPGLALPSLPEDEPPADARELAVLTTPGDDEELAHAIEWLVERPAWQRALGANARARVLERHTWGHHVGAILERLTALRG